MLFFVFVQTLNLRGHLIGPLHFQKGWLLIDVYARPSATNIFRFSPVDEFVNVDNCPPANSYT